MEAFRRSQIANPVLVPLEIVMEGGSPRSLTSTSKLYLRFHYSFGGPFDFYCAWTVPNRGRQSPKLRSIQPERNPIGANMKEIQLGNAVAVTVERLSQTEEDIVPNWGRQKSSSTAATNALLEVSSWPGASLRVDDTNSVHFDPPFNEFFCHNLPLKKNSPLSGGSFPQPTSSSKWVGESD